MQGNRGVACAVLAAVFYALNAPVSKLLLKSVDQSMMAAFLYLGCGVGMALVGMLNRSHARREDRLTRRELPYTLAMILLDVAAPIALMFGLSYASAENVSLLNNFEIVATSLIALIFFREAVSRRLWLGIALVTLSSMILSVHDLRSLSFSPGSLLVLLACACWGLENNCTRVLSAKDPLQIVVVKGIFSGLGALIVALISGEQIPNAAAILLTMLLGFAAYGLSIFFYIHAQRQLGAARTSAYYAIAPFIGVLLSWLIFRQPPTPSFLAALLIMIAGTVLVTKDTQQ